MAPYETNQHVIQCPDPSRAKWRQETVLRITRSQDGSIDPYLLDILRDGLTRYHQQLAPVLPASYPLKYTILINQQNTIGWDHIYQGRWSNAWSQLQDQYSSPNGSVQISGSLWILQAGRTLIDQWYKVWEMRNKDRHRRDNEQLQKQRATLIHCELRRLYNLRPQMCPVDRRIFYESAGSHIQRHPSIDQLEDWINTFRPAIMASIDQATQLGITRNTLLTEFPAFNPIDRTTAQAAGLPGG